MMPVGANAVVVCVTWLGLSALISQRRRRAANEVDTTHRNDITVNPWATRVNRQTVFCRACSEATIHPMDAWGLNELLQAGKATHVRTQKQHSTQ